MGGFIRKIFKIQRPPEFEKPPVEEPSKEIPKYYDKEREEDVKEEIETVEKQRRGRRSTILTSNQGLLEIADENIEQKNLLGGQ